MKDKIIKTVDDFVEAINEGINEEKTSRGNVTLKLGIPTNTLYYFLNRKNISISTPDLIRVLDILGFDIILKKRKK